MNHPDLLVSLSNGILSVMFNRPKKLNAINNGMARSLLQVIKGAAADASVRVLLLRGAGRAFCAGRDVGAPPTENDLVLVQGVAQALVSLPKPVVVAVHGWTLGAGLEWMLDCDVVIAASTTRFRLPEASLGVFVTGGLTATLTASAGLMRAKSLMLLGDEFSASQAHAWGLVSDVVEAGELEAAAQRICERLASLSPEVSSQFKKVLNEVGMGAFTQAISLENAAQCSLGAH
ncbi:enoyl-CoA hydratase/isomerase family protein [Hydrogenophaga sp.]|jgi:2-(1,2-epoxy-1,2-dihydrophenyl)acetyl-CoA isomerase|uniref:enoyl-CoA hydratase/isomerase family protein n=1 Tax=Hydrogenophaga sp. TaxID=1904254 RepID=UPI003F73050D